MLEMGEVAKNRNIEDHLKDGYRIELLNVTYNPSASSDKKVLDNIEINIKPNQFVAIIGRNAAGKTSILKAISGELPFKHLTGKVKIQGQIIDQPVNRIIDGVGIVHQSEEVDLIKHLSVAQNIAIRQIFGRGHPEKFFSTSQKWARETRELLGSIIKFETPKLEDIVKNLSGGQKQMLSVAIAIHFEHKKNPCRLLLLDEHTSKLDSQNARKIMELTISEIKKHNITAVMITHRHQDALEYANRIIIVRGREKINDIQNTKDISLEQLTLLAEGDNH